MNPNLERILESKRALRRNFACRPIAEKLRLLDALRHDLVRIDRDYRRRLELAKIYRRAEALLDADPAATLALMDRLVAMGAKAHGHTFLPLPGTPFRKAPPGALDAATRRALLRLASRGTLYGQWEQQAEAAQQMARASTVRRAE